MRIFKTTKMNIQKRVYKYHEQKEKIHQKISGIAVISSFTSKWVDENIFILKHKNPLIPFGIKGNISETEEKNKLEVFITADPTFLVLYILPAGLTLYGLMKWPKDPERGILLAFIGISLSIFISLFSSAIISKLKKSFKGALNII